MIAMAMLVLMVVQAMVEATHFKGAALEDLVDLEVFKAVASTLSFDLVNLSMLKTCLICLIWNLHRLDLK